MKKHWNKILEWGLWLVVCLPLFVACSDNDEGPGAEPVREKDCEVSVGIRLDIPVLKDMGDPGESPGDDVADWDKLELFLVYDWGQVLQYTLTKEELVAANPHSFNAYAGTLKGLYGVAYKTVAGAPTVSASNEEAIKNLRTAQLSNITTPEDKKAYMLSLFSGAKLASVDEPMEIKKDGKTELRIILSRLITKVDVQWDVEDAYASGVYTKVKMNEIEFFGLDSGFFFPENETQQLPSLGDGESEPDDIYKSAYKANSPISERNGRTYFYTFPGVANKFRFIVDYATNLTPNGNKTYIATFNEKLGRATWHKVNFTVKGESFTGGGNISLSPSTSTSK